MPIIITFSTWLTLIRIFLAPCVMATIFSSSWIIASLLFTIAASTDFFDGYYARLYHQETELGKILDPIADKVLMLVTLFALYLVCQQSYIPLWFVFLMAGKDVVLLLGGCYLIVQKKYKVMNPSLLSKWITALFMVFIVYLMLLHSGAMPAYYIDQLVQFFTINTIIILLDYSYKFYQQLQG